MEARAIARFVRVSPLKTDRVLRLIRGQQVDKAQEILAFSKRPIAIKIGKIHTGLGQLFVREFTFLAIPLKVRGATSFPVKAFVVRG